MCQKILTIFYQVFYSKNKLPFCDKNEIWEISYSKRSPKQSIIPTLWKIKILNILFQKKILQSFLLKK